MEMIRLDCIIFGATGFTGKYSALQLHKMGKDFPNLTWGIAGRNEMKLKEILDWLKLKTDEDLKNIPVIIADVFDEDSLKKMTVQCKVIINCCGPFDLYGEPVVKSCIATGTHYVDVTAETQYIQRIRNLYSIAAEEKGVYIVCACGLESIPVDLGVRYIQKHFDGTVNSVKTVLQFWTDLGIFIFPNANYGTYSSVIYIFANLRKLEEQERQYQRENKLDLKPAFKPRSLHKDDTTGKWCLQLPICDKDVALHTQRYFYKKEMQRPAQVEPFIATPNFLVYMAGIFFGFIFRSLCKFSRTRNFLLNHPKIFTCGVLSHDGPTDVNMENSWFSSTLTAKGWSSNIKSDNFSGIPLNKEMVVRIKARNPAYGFSCISLVLSALMILRESDKLPERGGVLSPAVVLDKTSYLEQLIKYGVEIKTLSSTNIDN